MYGYGRTLVIARLCSFVFRPSNLVECWMIGMDVISIWRDEMGCHEMSRMSRAVTRGHEVTRRRFFDLCASLDGQTRAETEPLDVEKMFDFSYLNTSFLHSWLFSLIQQQSAFLSHKNRPLKYTSATTAYINPSNPLL
jgi:hypothetical protein